MLGMLLQCCTCHMEFRSSGSVIKNCSIWASTFCRKNKCEVPCVTRDERKGTREVEHVIKFRKHVKETN